MAADTVAKTEQMSGAEGADSERERSTILFPYNDLDNAVRVAKGIHQVGGTTCQWEQLAGELKVSPKGGAFSLMMLTAKTFGLVTYGKGSVHLTQLGTRISDPKQEKAAKSDAFLTVPLYSEIYDKFKGATLPPDAALENEMVNLGAAKKQKDKARQTFQRSARQAGFFWAGRERLVMPSTGGAADPAPPKPDLDDQNENNRRRESEGGNGGGGRHPFIAGLIKELPKEGDDWATEDRGKWLQAAATIFELIYKNSGGGKVLKIEVQSAK